MTPGAIRARARRTGETPETRAARLLADAKRHSIARGRMTEQEANARRTAEREAIGRRRANETEEETDARRAADREAFMQRREGELLATELAEERFDKFLRDMDDNHSIGPVPVERQREIYNNLVQRLTVGMDEDVCAVCDNLVLMSTLKNLPASNLPLDAMRTRLAPPPDLPLALIAHYSYPCTRGNSSIVHVMHGPALIAHYSYPCQFLEGMLLSPKGIPNDSDLDNPQVNVCDSCYKSLTSSSVRGPPKYAIANGLFMGVLPVEFHDLTRTELSMTALAQSGHCISAIHGGSHKKLKSHSYAFAATAPPATMLPTNILEQGTFKVSIVGALTDAQRTATAAKYQVRSPAIRNVLDFFVANNPKYRNIQITMPEDGDLPSVLNESQTADV